MHTDWGSLMTHLKTFPMQAFQKQFMRNGRMMDMQAVASMMYGLATAYVAVNLRDLVDGRERSEMDRARTAFGYNNMTSWIGTVADPVLTGLGLDNLRFNPYGRFTDLTPPMISTMAKAMRIPGAAAKALTGNADFYDWQSLKAGPFANTYGLSRIYQFATREPVTNNLPPDSEPPEIDRVKTDQFVEGKKFSDKIDALLKGQGRAQ